MQAIRPHKDDLVLVLKEMQTAVVWSYWPFNLSVQNHHARNSERSKKKRQGRHRKRWEDNIRAMMAQWAMLIPSEEGWRVESLNKQWPVLDFSNSQRTMEIRG